MLCYEIMDLTTGPKELVRRIPQLLRSSLALLLPVFELSSQLLYLAALLRPPHPPGAALLQQLWKTALVCLFLQKVWKAFCAQHLAGLSETGALSMSPSSVAVT